jgi:predicted type IV restriction endonuclease
LSIAKAVADALGHENAPPPNESNTCEWVILPILYAIGYGQREVVSRDMDSAGKFPDYTLLPDIPDHTFYLEAKAWRVSLEDNHANQALNYANQNGKRWVVLTNGHEWRLYDNDTRGLAADKMVASMAIGDTDQAIRFLEAIGKESVCSDMLADFAAEEARRRVHAADEERRRQELASRQSRLSTVLNAELTQESSPLVASMLAHLRGREGLSDVSVQDVVNHFTHGAPTPGAPGRRAGQTGPTSSEKVLVIPARDAWQDYLDFSAYVCQPNRSFQATSRIAFYVRGWVETLVPRILETVLSVELSESGIRKRTDLSKVTCARLRELVGRLGAGKGQRHLHGEREVRFLSAPKDSDTIVLPHRIENDCVAKTGRPWAFVVGQRYVPLARLLASPTKTSELIEG